MYSLKKKHLILNVSSKLKYKTCLFLNLDKEIDFIFNKSKPSELQNKVTVKTFKFEFIILIKLNKLFEKRNSL